MEDIIKKKRIAKNIIINIALVLSVFLLLGSVFYVVVGDKNNGFLGFKPFIVISDSMEPTYPKYTLVVIKTTDVENVKEGEGIAFRSGMVSGAMVFHRAMEITPFGIITKGDANDSTDSEIVNEINFVGREFFHISLAGEIYKHPFLYSLFGIIIIILAAILLLVYKRDKFL
jgi:signal peptidase